MSRHSKKQAEITPTTMSRKADPTGFPAGFIEVAQFAPLSNGSTYLINKQQLS